MYGHELTNFLLSTSTRSKLIWSALENAERLSADGRMTRERWQALKVQIRLVARASCLDLLGDLAIRWNRLDEHPDLYAEIHCAWDAAFYDEFKKAINEGGETFDDRKDALWDGAP
jgi:hypothetical protein